MALWGDSCVFRGTFGPPVDRTLEHSAGGGCGESAGYGVHWQFFLDEGEGPTFQVFLDPVCREVGECGGGFHLYEFATGLRWISEPDACTFTIEAIDETSSPRRFRGSASCTGLAQEWEGLAEDLALTGEVEFSAYMLLD